MTAPQVTPARQATPAPQVTPAPAAKQTPPARTPPPTLPRRSPRRSVPRRSPRRSAPASRATRWPATDGALPPTPASPARTLTASANVTTTSANAAAPPATTWTTSSTGPRVVPTMTTTSRSSAIPAIGERPSRRSNEANSDVPIGFTACRRRTQASWAHADCHAVECMSMQGWGGAPVPPVAPTAFGLAIRTPPGF